MGREYDEFDENYDRDEVELQEDIEVEASQTYEYNFWAEQARTSHQEEPKLQLQPEQKEEPELQIEPVKQKKKHMLRNLIAVAAVGIVVGLGGVALVNNSAKETTTGNVTTPGSVTPTEAPLVQDEATGALSENADSSSSDNQIAVTQTIEANLVGENGVVGVVQQAMPSTVQITITAPTTNYFGQTYNATASGSGIILKEENGKLLIITNYHVVEGATTIDVIFVDDEVVSATVKGYDSISDLAVLEVDLSAVKDETKSEIKVATLGSSEDAKVGEMAIAIGNALGYGQSVTVGYVSAKDRIVDVDGITMVLLQTDAAINPGNSGGALFNAKGEVIGINSVKLSDEAVEGMGYAIPITQAIPIINDLMEREILEESEKGYLGISGQSVDEYMNIAYNMPAGVFVYEVSPDGAAFEGGIKANDIITQINDIEVTSIEALAERVNSYRKGTEVTFIVQRQMNNNAYEEMEIKVTLKGRETLDSLESATGDSEQNTTEESAENPYGDNSEFFQNFPWDVFQ